MYTTLKVTNIKDDKQMSTQTNSCIEHFALKIGLDRQELKKESDRRARSFLNSVADWFARHYFALNLFASLYAVLGIPFQLFLIGANQLLNIILVMVFILIPIILTELVVTNAAVFNPSSITKTLKLRNRFLQIFWVLTVGVILVYSAFFVVAFYCSSYLPVFDIILPAILFAMVGTSLVEASIAGLAIGLLVSRKDRRYFRFCARTYFIVVADCVTNNEHTREICDFKSAIDNVNDYLRSKYKLQLLKGQEYYNYFRTVIFTGNDYEKQRLKEAIVAFADKLQNEINLNETLTATRNIRGKVICCEEDILSELDYEVGTKKWFSQHKETLMFFIALTTFIGTILEMLINGLLF
jgi:hypothetical protein